MVLRRDTSDIGTVIGIIVVGVAVAGSVFLDWEWGRPDGRLLPLVIGIVVAAVAVTVTVRTLRN